LSSSISSYFSKPSSSSSSTVVPSLIAEFVVLALLSGLKAEFGSIVIEQLNTLATVGSFAKEFEIVYEQAVVGGVGVVDDKPVVEPLC
jgi:hypothetical protein